MNQICIRTTSASRPSLNGRCGTCALDCGSVTHAIFLSWCNGRDSRAALHRRCLRRERRAPMPHNLIRSVLTSLPVSAALVWTIGASAQDDNATALAKPRDPAPPANEAPAPPDADPVVVACYADEECPDGFQCVFSGVDSGGGTAPAGVATTPVGPCEPGGDCVSAALLIAPTGTCQAAPVPECTSDADCPTPATCESSRCIYEPAPCETSDLCGAGYSCQTFGSSVCSSSPCAGSAGGATPPETVAPATGTAAPGSTNPDPDATIPKLLAAPAGTGGAAASDPKVPTDGSEPPPATGDVPSGGVPCVSEVQCTEVEDKYCFPTPVACNTSMDCPTDWVCAAVPAGGPEEWANLSFACLPPGVDAAIKGTIATTGIGSVQEDTSGMAIDENGNAVGTPGPQAPSANPGEGTGAGLNPVGVEQKSGCAVAQGLATRGTSGGQTATWLGLATLLGLMGMRARQRRAS